MFELFMKLFIWSEATDIFEEEVLIPETTETVIWEVKDG